MGTRGVWIRHAREHGGVIAVVAVTVIGVLVAGTFADSHTHTTRVALTPTVAVQPTVPPTVPAASGATSEDTAAGPDTGGFASAPEPLLPIASAPGPTTTVGIVPGQAAPKAVPPASVLPPLGDLSTVDTGIRNLCATLLEPFGLYATVFGLVGAAIPFTLPELPFSILVGPISDLCLQLEGLTP